MTPSVVIVGDQVVQPGRDQRLAAVRGAADTRRPVHIHADIVAVNKQRLAGVQAHPDQDRIAVQPRVGLEGPLRVGGRGDRLAG